MAEFKYAPMFQLGEDKTEYYKIPGSEQYVSTGEFEGHEMLKVAKEGLTVMANTAFRDVSFMLRPEHNEMVAKILHDPEASENDKYVALPCSLSKTPNSGSGWHRQKQIWKMPVRDNRLLLRESLLHKII